MGGAALTISEHRAWGQGEDLNNRSLRPCHHISLCNPDLGLSLASAWLLIACVSCGCGKKGDVAMRVRPSGRLNFTFAQRSARSGY